MEIGDFYAQLFQEVFSCLERSGGAVTCFICGQTSDQVYEALIERFEEKYKDDAARLHEALEVTNSQAFSFVTFRTVCPLCRMCYWDLSDKDVYVRELGDDTIETLLYEVHTQGEELWPHPDEMRERS